MEETATKIPNEFVDNYALEGLKYVPDENKKSEFVTDNSLEQYAINNTDSNNDSIDYNNLFDTKK